MIKEYTPVIVLCAVIALSAGLAIQRRFVGDAGTAPTIVATDDGAVPAIIPPTTPPVPTVWNPDFNIPLSDTTWDLVGITDAQGDPVAIPTQTAFGIDFIDRTRLSIRTDCNSGSSEYTIDGAGFTLGPIMTTRKYCADSYESQFIQIIERTTEYTRSQDELVLITSQGYVVRFKRLVSES
jgi:heat shock protein HslJ